MPRRNRADSRSVEPNKAVFLDRDGTIIEDLGYLDDPGKILFIPGAREAMRALQEAGFLLVLITNQSGVARGYFSEDLCRKIDERLREVLSRTGVNLDGSYYCPHLPGAVATEYDMKCGCRKPAPGLFEKAARELHIDFSKSWAVGDMLRDLAPAKQLGAKTILVLTGKGGTQLKDENCARTADFVVDDIAGAADAILRGRGNADLLS